MIVNIEQDACFGRGFVNNGLLQNFQSWITRPPVDNPDKISNPGGPGWYIIEDQSGLTDPYIVVSNHDAATVTNNPNAYGSDAHKILKVGYLYGAPAKISLDAYRWWDIGSPGTGYGLVGASGTPTVIDTYDASNFTYDFRGGPDFISVATRLGSSTWKHFLLDSFTGDSLFLQPVTSFGILQDAVFTAPGANIVLTLIDAGQASNFTVGKYYYIFDINASGTKHDWVNYSQVTGVGVASGLLANQIRVDYLRYNFPAGSVLHSYPYRYFVMGSQANLTLTSVYVPFISVKVTDDQWWSYVNQYPMALFDYDSTCIDRLSPDDEQRYVTQKAWLVEKGAVPVPTGTGNKALGQSNSIFIGSIKNTAQMLDGKLIDDGSGVREYIYGSNIQLDQFISVTACTLLPNFNSIV